LNTLEKIIIWERHTHTHTKACDQKIRDNGNVFTTFESRKKQAWIATFQWHWQWRPTHTHTHTDRKKLVCVFGLLCFCSAGNELCVVLCCLLGPGIRSQVLEVLEDGSFGLVLKLEISYNRVIIISWEEFFFWVFSWEDFYFIFFLKIIFLHGEIFKFP